MGKLIFFILVGVLIFWGIRRHLRGVKKGDEESPGGEEDMVCCLHCGIHLPKSECVSSEGKFFCSDEHRRLHLES
ncbi:MAG: PP0621 family protein [Nitrosomonadaceae bacterium]|nr:preprotein translocase subunit YajC [Nitrosospira sp.]MDW7598178.1 PP0621 family protein [Nitrosomonadaceae bacterium]MBI0409336.1 preprotein translocase subunit YajC [Nitrosospira sp.]MBI0410030.1 preprotein translocase subunit YajC [Nitrosospira sp.]MBI0411610.1 preprotein translocase subunit YajC [Nitrosospira sp.]